MPKARRRPLAPAGLAAASPRAAPSGAMRSAAMRLRCLRSTSKRNPWKLNVCLGSGIARASWMTRPAMVAASSSGRFQSIARLRSRIVTEPSTMTEPSSCLRTPWASNVVLVLDVADDLLDDVLERHQAQHHAVFVDHQRRMGLAAQERLQLVAQRRRLGNEPGLQRDVGDLEPARVAARRREGAKQILGVQHADDVVGVAAPQRHARIGRSEHLAHQLVGRQIGVDACASWCGGP